MDWYIKLTAWATVATAIATAMLVFTGLGALIFAWYQIRSERVYRRVENIEREIEKFDTGSCANARKVFAATRLESGNQFCTLNHQNAPSAAYEMLDFFEHIGHLARAGHLDTRAVWHRFGWWILIISQDANQLVKKKRAKSKTVLCDFEWLVERVAKVEKKEEGQTLNITHELMTSFYRDEIRSGGGVVCAD
jgi:hypothetical protein